MILKWEEGLVDYNFCLSFITRMPGKRLEIFFKAALLRACKLAWRMHSPSFPVRRGGD